MADEVTPGRNLADVISEVTARRSEVIEKMAASIRASIPVYEVRPDEQLAAELLAHVRANVDTFLECVAAGRTPNQTDLGFIREAMERRVDQGVPLEDVLQAFRVGLQAFWETIIDVSAKHRYGSDAALMLALPAMQYIDVASSEVTESYLRIEERLRVNADRAQVQALRALLDGRSPDDRILGEIAGQFRLERSSRYLAVVVLEVQDREGVAVRQAIEKFGRRGDLRGSLIEVDAGRVTALIALGNIAPDVAASRLRDEILTGGDEAATLKLGVGIPASNPADLPKAHHEAITAARLAAAGDAVVMPDLGVVARAAVMMSSAGEAGRLVPTQVIEFLEEDSATGGTLTETVLVYCDCDLNARRTADRLYVHANTVLYRLERVAERSGLDPRIARELTDLILAMSLQPGQVSMPSPDAA